MELRLEVVDVGSGDPAADGVVAGDQVGDDGATAHLCVTKSDVEVEDGWSLISCGDEGGKTKRGERQTKGQRKDEDGSSREFGFWGWGEEGIIYGRVGKLRASHCKQVGGLVNGTVGTCIDQICTVQQDNHASTLDSWIHCIPGCVRAATNLLRRVTRVHPNYFFFSEISLG